MKKFSQLNVPAKIGTIVAALVVFFLAAQLIPYGKDHTNPPVVSEPQWANPETRALAKRACFDCHSNETNWDRWYINIAPASWLIQHDVEEGRSRMNFSDWANYSEDINRIVRVVEEGEMPPLQYMPMHPEASFTAAEKQQFIDGLQQTR